ncbi:MAG: FecR domain-containing protein, partial [Firmicutes bacterium]|nr:FecR domain-containing protein [Bacillota bacterium]
MKKKALLFGGIGAAVVAIAVILILVLSGGDSYRSIIVVEARNNVTVKRDGTNLQAFANMKLRSGDVVEVPGSGFARLKLDGDKYVYLEENTTIFLQAEGDEKNSKTIIYVEKGNMLTEIESKLSDESTFNVVTPNTTMAIRGTITSTSVWQGYYNSEEGVIVYKGEGNANTGTDSTNGEFCTITDTYIYEGEVLMTGFGKNNDRVEYFQKVLSKGEGLQNATPVDKIAGTEYVKEYHVKDLDVVWTYPESGDGKAFEDLGDLLEYVNSLPEEYAVTFLFPDRVDPTGVKGTEGSLDEHVVVLIQKAQKEKAEPAPTDTPAPTEVPATPTPTSTPIPTPTPTEEPTPEPTVIEAGDPTPTEIEETPT